MPERIPKSVAKRVVFRAIGSSDHVTPATGKTIAITISKNGAAFGNPAAGATNATEISSGFYYFDLGTGDTGTSGPLAWRGAGTGIDDVGDVYEVVNATNAGFSALPDVASGSAGAIITSGSGTAQLSVSGGIAQADIQTIKTQTVTASAGVTVGAYVGNATAALSVDASGRVDIGKTLGTAVTLDANNVLNVSSKYWAGTAITASSIPVATAAGAAGGLFIAGSNAATTVASLTCTAAFSINGTSNVAQTGDNYARLGAPAGASVSADIAALPSATTNADTLLNRDMSTGSDSGSPSVRTVRQALRVLRNKVTVSAGTMTVTKEDDTTSSWTAAVTSDPTANPIVTIDPA